MWKIGPGLATAEFRDELNAGTNDPQVSGLAKFLLQPFPLRGAEQSGVCVWMRNISAAAGNNVVITGRRAVPEITGVQQNNLRAFGFGSKNRRAINAFLLTAR